MKIKLDTDKYKCAICPVVCNSAMLFSNHVRRLHGISIQAYYKKYIHFTSGLCKMCGAPTKFVNIREGFKIYCSRKCSRNDPDVQAKIDHTSLIKYGTKSPAQAKVVEDKREQTNTKKYGGKSPWCDSTVKAKAIQTNNERYGTDYPIQNEEVRSRYLEAIRSTEAREKALSTLSSNYGVDNPTKHPKILAKVKCTNLERTGYEFPTLNPEVRQKMIKSCKEHLGVDNPSKSPEIARKISKTNSSTEVRQRTEETCIKRFGFKNPASNPEIAKKISKTCSSEKTKNLRIKNSLELHGYKFPVQSPEIRAKIAKTLASPEVQSKIKRKYSYNGNSFDSSWELAFFIYHIDHGSKIQVHPSDKEFLYNYSGFVHRYYPDFKLDGKYVEIKGSQFFNKDKFGNPYDSSKDLLYQAKYQCMVDNSVIIITDCSKYLLYIKNTYGKDYLEQFRNVQRL